MITTSQTFREINLLEAIKMGVHDIRSPITFLMVLQTSATNLSPREKSLLDCATQRIVGVVDSMAKLLYSNFENDSGVNASELVNLSSIIEKIILEKEYEYKGLNIKFVYMPPAHSADYLVQNEINNLERMISNLLNNAIEACNENGIISISLESKDKMLYLSIIDNGNGMPDEVLQKLRNGVTVTFGKKNGHGIGFNQIRNVVSRLNGSLSINSTLGVGSEVQISLPLAR